VAKLNLGRTGAHAAAIRRETKVARRVELRIQRRTGAGQLLQHLADGIQPGAFDLAAGKGLDRHLAFDLGALDAGSGDFHPVQFGGGAGSILRGGKGGDGQQAQRYGSRQGAVMQVVHSLSLQRNGLLGPPRLPLEARQRLLCKQPVKMKA